MALTFAAFFHVLAEELHHSIVKSTVFAARRDVASLCYAAAPAPRCSSSKVLDIFTLFKHFDDSMRGTIQAQQGMISLTFKGPL